jgi:hypothetical protein
MALPMGKRRIRLREDTSMAHGGSGQLRRRHVQCHACYGTGHRSPAMVDSDMEQQWLRPVE